MSALGLSTLWNVIVAPRAAFEELRVRPTWLIAFVFTAIATVVATIIMEPAVAHALSASLPTQMAQDPRSATLTAEQKNQALTMSLSFVRFGWLVSLISTIPVVAVSAVVLLVASIAGRGTTNFARTFALSMNVAFIWAGLGQLIAALIVALRGPDAFAAPFELSLAVPSLAWLVPSAPPKVLGFLAGINPFAVWGVVLLGAGITAIAKIRPVIGYAASVLLLLCGCGLLSLGAR